MSPSAYWSFKFIELCAVEMHIVIIIIITFYFLGFVNLLNSVTWAWFSFIFGHFSFYKLSILFGSLIAYNYKY